MWSRLLSVLLPTLLWSTQAFLVPHSLAAGGAIRCFSRGRREQVRCCLPCHCVCSYANSKMHRPQLISIPPAWRHEQSFSSATSESHYGEKSLADEARNMFCCSKDDGEGTGIKRRCYGYC